MRYRKLKFGILFLFSVIPISQESEAEEMETLHDLRVRRYQEGADAYFASRFAQISRDYFLRFSRDPDARPKAGEVLLDEGWNLFVPEDSEPLVELMAGHLRDFLRDRMGVFLELRKGIPGENEKALVASGSGGGDPSVPESFTIAVSLRRIEVRGLDPEGLRDGVVKLVDRIGFREVPILEIGERVYRPRLAVRLGTPSWGGSYRDLVFRGHNAVNAGGGELYALSDSEAIPELKYRRVEGLRDTIAQSVAHARTYGLKTFLFLTIRDKFPADHPVFQAHPEIRGALTWKEDGEYTLCTEHPLVKQYLAESLRGLFKAVPGLDGIVIIIGGEGFYHCFMRSYGTAKGHTNCLRCEEIGADSVVANLCNHLANAAREINPEALVLAWPYSAEHVWSLDRPHTGFIRRLEPGTGIFTEMEKDEWMEKPYGLRKNLWDYSIDLIGPGERAREQIRLCKEVGIPIFMKSDPEIGYEAVRLPHIPCMDRWLDRSEALASCGADGTFVMPAFRPNYGTSASEVYKFAWWEPVKDREEILRDFAARLAGPEAGPHLREAWRHVSEAIAWSPELPPYYMGPAYLGPAHPMCADPEAKVPEVFYGYYFFWAEIEESEGGKTRPTFFVSPAEHNIQIFGLYYREMEQTLRKAVDEIEAASPRVGERHRLMFDAEASPIRWFYHTARSAANFYESCQIRDRLLRLAEKKEKTIGELEIAREEFEGWRQLLLNEKDNVLAAIPVALDDPRLDFRFGGDHSFSPSEDMLRAKMELLDFEMTEFLPELARRCGI